MRSPCQQRSKGRTAVHNPTDDGKKSVRITVDHRSPFCQGKSLSVLQLAPPIHARSQALHTHCLNDQRHTCQSFQVSKEHRLRNQHDSVCCNPSIKVLIVAQCWCKEALRALQRNHIRFSVLQPQYQSNNRGAMLVQRSPQGPSKGITLSSGTSRAGGQGRVARCTALFAHTCGSLLSRSSLSCRRVCERGGSEREEAMTCVCVCVCVLCVCV